MNGVKYKVEPEFSIGRLFHAGEENDGLNFVRDQGRIIFSSSFRRLEYKTQVFVNHSGDHYRTRLTHSLEVAYIAKYISRQLQLNEELTETIALAHDLGHPPFGHAGEDSLSAAMKDFGGFDHNFHTLKIIGELEKSAGIIKGLNLSYEVIEGLVKHNGPLEADSILAIKIMQLFEGFDLQLEKRGHLESQIASLADDIAYCIHDIEDGLRAGFFTLKEIKAIPIVEHAMYASNDDQQAMLQHMRDAMIADLLFETKQTIYNSNFQSAQAIREHQGNVAKFSFYIEAQQKMIKEFLMQRVYMHCQVDRMRYKTNMVISALFSRFMESPNCLPENWCSRVSNLDDASKAIIVSDYIAGMTDRFAIDEYRRIFDLTIL